jgi:hypothetical protein
MPDTRLPLDLPCPLCGELCVGPDDLAEHLMWLNDEDGDGGACPGRTDNQLARWTALADAHALHEKRKQRAALEQREAEIRQEQNELWKRASSSHCRSCMFLGGWVGAFGLAPILITLGVYWW